MANILDSIINAVSPQAGLRRAYARYQRNRLVAMNGYDAAGKGRRGLRGAGTNQNSESRRSLVNLRNNARELQRNNPYVATATDVIVSNTIGSGIKPVASHPTSKKKKKLADELMAEWASSLDCDFDGRLNLYGLQALCMQTESLSGEALAVRRIVNDPRMRIPLKIQMLEGDFLDHTRDGVYGTGGDFIQGIQFKGGERQYYWLYENHPAEITGRSVISKPVSADQVAHVYELRRPGQVRGVPRGVSAYMRLKGLDDYQDARLELQKMASCLAGFIYSDSGEAGKGDILPERIEPGMLARLSGDERVAFNNPPPVSDHASYIIPEQRIIASAYGITYEALTGDYSKVNFASGKMGRIQMYSNIHRWRHNMVIPQFCKTLERWFIEAAALRGYDLSGVTFTWTPPKKEILDPNAEITAIIKEVRSGLNSWQGACRERGLDPEKVAQQLKEDIDLFDRYGLVLDIDARRTTNSGQMQSVPGHNPAEGTDLTTDDEGLKDEAIED